MPAEGKAGGQGKGQTPSIQEGGRKGIADRKWGGRGQRISQAANNKGLPEKRQSIFKQTSEGMKMLFKGKTDKKQKV